jgi:hypothetical protein
MCAFMPASANCKGRTPRRPRDSTSGAHARHGSPAPEDDERVEEEIREDDIERAQEPHVFELLLPRRGRDCLRDGEVERRECPHAVARRERDDDRPHPRDGVLDPARGFAGQRALASCR